MLGVLLGVLVTLTVTPTRIGVETPHTKQSLIAASLLTLSQQVLQTVGVEWGHRQPSL
jgi:hypothetical protein